VQVLRLLETFEMDHVHGAVRQALELGAIGYDAVKHLVLCRIERRPPRLDLDIYPYLPRARVETTRPASYMSLMSRSAVMSETPQVLLQHHLKKLKLPTFLREHTPSWPANAPPRVDHVAIPAPALRAGADRAGTADDRTHGSRPPSSPPPRASTASTSRRSPRSTRLDLDLARCEFVDRRENVIALGPSGTGKTHVALGLGLAACQRGLKTRFATAAAIVHELIEAVEKRLLRLQKTLASHELLIIDELGFVPLSKTGAELLFELISQRYERGSTIITSNLPFDEWTARSSARSVSPAPSSTA
jgi:hypothetical protein